MIFGWNSKKSDSLTAEQQQIIDRAESLLNQTKELHKKEAVGNLTSSWMLRDDCQLVERSIKDFRKNPSAKNGEKLTQATLRLQTTSENILNWKFTE